MSKGKRKLVPETIAIDSDNPSSESLDNQMPECFVLSLSGCKKLSEGEAEVPQVVAPFPRRPRTKSRVSPKNAILQEKKIDSGAFEYHFQNLWRSFSEDKRTSFAYLDCLWFALYRKPHYKAKVITWIKKKQIFSKKFVFVPIVCWNHWSLLIFCHFGESLQSKTITPCMLLLDSLEMGNPRRLEPEIRKFAVDIYKAEGRPESKSSVYKIPLLVPKVPQQRNGEECGIYVLYFINLFMEDAPEDFSIEDYPYFMRKNWFTLQGLESFCQKLGSLRKKR
ncbi:hypothetical protein I3760_11G011300 [Carya illinoinensis]|uniref:Ubiquitin-like protease family profile domain-containing protein n=1 Tax=Carya illinoinensis TaxID=32201 RepID=A0A8T1P119_CARIL|nr:probable ubiquitin-like-specific protease 2A [Carya illinoinensis]KAG2678639.1 hypothetical protein I3760_11G011300 [Carya illinoinensis]KAG6635003.1 hypothetical protein CIPAW_11G012000 [Carya illinoinensis]